jgi:pyridoxamine 5'-phosphate oxidase
MIKLRNLNQEKPFLVFEEKYNDALLAKQKNIEAVCISSYSMENKEVNARYVNLKFINDREFIFFSNYKSPKANDFQLHNQVTVLIYWNSTNVQIRMKGNIKKTSRKFNQAYFKNRDKNKNALAISSEQSCSIPSYEDVNKLYRKSLENENLIKCPNYWGGYAFTPYYFEFWEGHMSRLNKREVYEKSDDSWKHLILQP